MPKSVNAIKGYRFISKFGAKGEVQALALTGGEGLRPPRLTVVDKII